MAFRVSLKFDCISKRNLLRVVAVVFCVHLLAACAYKTDWLNYEVPRAGGGVDQVSVQVKATENLQGPGVANQRYNITINGRTATVAESERILKLIYIPKIEYNEDASSYSPGYSDPFGDPQRGIRPKS